MEEVQNTPLAKSFECFIPIQKAKETAEGDWLVVGPVYDHTQPDYDKETLEKSGIENGLKEFWRLGRHVDIEHLYAKSVRDGKADWDLVIGKGIDLPEIDGKPGLVTRLFKSKDQAQKVWRHLQDGGEAGYSIEGMATRRDPNDPKHVLDTEIHRVTITLSPKSYGSRISPLAKSLVEEAETGNTAEWKALPALVRDLSENEREQLSDWIKGLISPTSPEAVSENPEELEKALSPEAMEKHRNTINRLIQFHKGRGSFPENPKPFELTSMHGHANGIVAGLEGHLKAIEGKKTKKEAVAASEEHIHKNRPFYVNPTQYQTGYEGGARMGHNALRALGTKDEDEWHKSLTTGTGIVADGATGGQALRGQCMAGSDNVQEKCKKCGTKNRASRKKCRHCGMALHPTTYGSDQTGKGVTSEDLLEKMAIHPAEGQLHPHLQALIQGHEYAKKQAEQHFGADSDMARFHKGAIAGAKEAAEIHRTTGGGSDGNINLYNYVKMTKDKLSHRPTPFLHGAHCGADAVLRHAATPDEVSKAYVGFDRLKRQIAEKEGYSEEEAAATAAAIGRKKYGKRGMARRAEAGRAAAKSAVVEDTLEKGGIDHSSHISAEALRAHNERAPLPVANDNYNRANKLGTIAERTTLSKIARYKNGIFSDGKLTRKDVTHHLATFPEDCVVCHRRKSAIITTDESGRRIAVIQRA